MASALSEQQALLILYDLAQNIGSEVRLEPLLTRTLQRFMYHTGLPVGLLLADPAPAGPGRRTARLELVIGDYALAKRKGQQLELPATLLEGGAELGESPELLAHLPTRHPQKVFLRLPVEGYGVILLLGSAKPDTGISFADLFYPILAQLYTSITLCRAYEQETRREVERQARHDPRTGLPNGVLFGEALREAVGQAKASHSWLAVMQLNVDDFRQLNETYGSELCDQLLLALAQNLEGNLRPGELLAHLSGDEFAVLLPNLRGWQDVDERIVRILQTNSSALSYAGQDYDIFLSAGISILPEDAEDADTLMRHAQMALHQAKQESRGTFRLFDIEQNRRTQQRRHLLKRLGEALEQGELQLFYQPKVDMPTGKVVGFEALLRWFDPVRGMVPPMEFLPALENSDFIITLGEWVMREALAQAVTWRAAGLETCISVNIAGRHLQLADFPQRVRQALFDVPGAKPEYLEIEVLESSTFEDFEHIRDVMLQCAALGVRFSLDDFGTGYSSLAYLHQLPVSTIKIDQLFVRNLFRLREDPAIIQAIVQIAQVFGRNLVAEGVEDPEHGMLLTCMGCHLGQGYGIGRPMAASAVLPWVESYQGLAVWKQASTLQWHPALYELLRLRNAHRQWRAQVEAWLDGQEGATTLPHPDHCGLMEWFMVSGPGGQHDLLREGFALMGQLIDWTHRVEGTWAEAGPDAREAERQALARTSDNLLKVLDALAASFTPSAPNKGQTP